MSDLASLVSAASVCSHLRQSGAYFNQQTLPFLLFLMEGSLTSSQVLAGQKQAWTDISLSQQRPESPNKMAAFLTVMNEQLIQGKIHSADPVNPNLR